MTQELLCAPSNRALPQQVQVAKILAAQKLIHWPLNQQLGRKPPINVNEAPLRLTGRNNEEVGSRVYWSTLRQLPLATYLTGKCTQDNVREEFAREMVRIHSIALGLCDGKLRGR